MAGRPNRTRWAGPPVCCFHVHQRVFDRGRLPASCGHVDRGGDLVGSPRRWPVEACRLTSAAADGAGDDAGGIDDSVVDESPGIGKASETGANRPAAGHRHLIAFLTLTLAISAVTTTFSIVDAVALRSLPFPDDHLLVAIARVRATNPQPGVVAPQDYLRQQTVTDIWIPGCLEPPNAIRRNSLESGPASASRSVWRLVPRQAM